MHGFPVPGSKKNDRGDIGSLTVFNALHRHFPPERSITLQHTNYCLGIERERCRSSAKRSEESNVPDHGMRDEYSQIVRSRIGRLDEEPLAVGPIVQR